MINSRWRKLVAVLAALLLVTAACGTDDDTAVETAEAAAESASSVNDDAVTPATDAAAEATPEPAVEEATEEAEESTPAPAADARPSDWPTKIVFGAVPAEAADKLEADFDTTRRILESELGIEIEFFQASDYAGVIEGIIANRVDVAQFGPFSYVIAVNNGADIDVAGVMTEGVDIEPGYRAYGITQPGSGIASIEDFAGRTICFVDPGSTSGYLFPSEGLLAAGIDPSETSTDITSTFAGGHDASAISVANGDCDAGFAYDAMITSELIESGDIAGVIDRVEGTETINEAEAELEIIWKSEVIAGSPMAISNSLPASFVEAYIEVVTTKVNVDWALANGFCTGTLEENDCSFADEDGTWGFVAKDDAYYDGVRQVCVITNSSKCA